METNQKIINNAVSSYFMLFICIAFLFAKNNKLLYNPFVKWHAKTAFLIHIMFLLVYIIFVFLWALSNIRMLDFSLNHIIASGLFIFLFLLLLFWMYRAYRWKTVSIWEMILLKWRLKNITINKHTIKSEEWKLTLILACIPFVWYIIYWKNFINKTIKDINKINLISSLIIAFFYVSWGNNIAIFLILIYIVVFAFTSVILVVNNENKTPDLSWFPSSWNIHTLIKSYFKYLKTYFKKEEFIWIRNTRKAINTNQIKLENNLFKELKLKKETKLSKNLIYIPVLNLLFLFSLKSRFRIHIINSLIITLLATTAFIIFRDINISLLALFPICYWMGYINRLWYKMPFIYDIFTIFESIYKFFRRIFWRVNKIKNTKKEVSMKVGEKKEVSPQKTTITNNFQKQQTKEIPKPKENQQKTTI